MSHNLCILPKVLLPLSLIGLKLEVALLRALTLGLRLLALGKSSHVPLESGNDLCILLVGISARLQQRPGDLPSFGFGGLKH